MAVVTELLWQGGEKPTQSDIDQVKDNLLERDNEEGRDTFRQERHDFLLLQQRRHLALLGWKTLELMNIYVD